jgi:hypothetical protein
VVIPLKSFVFIEHSYKKLNEHVDK